MRLPKQELMTTGFVLTMLIHRFRLETMDTTYELNGMSFVWDEDKARANIARHDVSFEEAASAFFDPLFRIGDAGVEEEARDALIGFSEKQRLLYIVHILIEEESIRLISARKATSEEQRRYDDQ